MDGTILRTIAAIAVSLHTALLATDVTGFDNPTVDLVYKIASLVLNFVVIAIATYYNNDYTDEATLGTDITRRLKEDPTLIVTIEDGDEEDEDDDEADAEAEDEVEEE